jgi:hypothetical protein
MAEQERVAAIRRRLEDKQKEEEAKVALTHHLSSQREAESEMAAMQEKLNAAVALEEGHAAAMKEMADSSTADLQRVREACERRQEAALETAAEKALEAHEKELDEGRQSSFLTLATRLASLEGDHARMLQEVVDDASREKAEAMAEQKGNASKELETAMTTLKELLGAQFAREKEEAIATERATASKALKATTESLQAQFAASMKAALERDEDEDADDRELENEMKRRKELKVGGMGGGDNDQCGVGGRGGGSGDTATMAVSANGGTSADSCKQESPHPAVPMFANPMSSPNEGSQSSANEREALRELESAGARKRREEADQARGDALQTALQQARKEYGASLQKARQSADARVADAAVKATANADARVEKARADQEVASRAELQATHASFEAEMAAAQHEHEELTRSLAAHHEAAVSKVQQMLEYQTERHDKLMEAVNAEKSSNGIMDKSVGGGEGHGRRGGGDGGGEEGGGGARMGLRERRIGASSSSVASSSSFSISTQSPLSPSPSHMGRDESSPYSTTAPLQSPHAERVGSWYIKTTSPKLSHVRVLALTPTPQKVRSRAVLDQNHVVSPSMIKTMMKSPPVVRTMVRELNAVIATSLVRRALSQALSNISVRQAWAKASLSAALNDAGTVYTRHGGRSDTSNGRSGRLGRVRGSESSRSPTHRGANRGATAETTLAGAPHAANLSSALEAATVVSLQSLVLELRASLERHEKAAMDGALSAERKSKAALCAAEEDREKLRGGLLASTLSSREEQETSQQRIRTLEQSLSLYRDESTDTETHALVEAKAALTAKLATATAEAERGRQIEERSVSRIAELEDSLAAAARQKVNDAALLTEMRAQHEDATATANHEREVTVRRVRVMEQRLARADKEREAAAAGSNPAAVVATAVRGRLQRERDASLQQMQMLEDAWTAEQGEAAASAQRDRDAAAQQIRVLEHAVQVARKEQKRATEDAAAANAKSAAAMATTAAAAAAAVSTANAATTTTTPTLPVFNATAAGEGATVSHDRHKLAQAVHAAADLESQVERYKHRVYTLETQLVVEQTTAKDATGALFEARASMDAARRRANGGAWGSDIGLALAAVDTVGEVASRRGGMVGETVVGEGGVGASGRVEGGAVKETSNRPSNEGGASSLDFTRVAMTAETKLVRHLRRELVHMNELCASSIQMIAQLRVESATAERREAPRHSRVVRTEGTSVVGMGDGGEDEDGSLHSESHSSPSSRSTVSDNTSLLDKASAELGSSRSWRRSLSSSSPGGNTVNGIEYVHGFGVRGDGREDISFDGDASGGQRERSTANATAVAAAIAAAAAHLPRVDQHYKYNQPRASQQRGRDNHPVKAYGTHGTHEKRSPYSESHTQPKPQLNPMNNLFPGVSGGGGVGGAAGGGGGGEGGGRRGEWSGRRVGSFMSSPASPLFPTASMSATTPPTASSSMAGFVVEEGAFGDGTTSPGTSQRNAKLSISAEMPSPLPPSLRTISHQKPQDDEQQQQQQQLRARTDSERLTGRLRGEHRWLDGSSTTSRRASAEGTGNVL